MSDRRSSDWFAVTRGVFEHPVLAGEFDRRSAWLWLVAHAAWKPHIARARGGIFELHRGQVLVGRDHLAEAWGWTPKRVRRFVAELCSQGMLEMGHRTSQYANVATICNFERYQAAGQHEGPAAGPTSDGSPGHHAPFDPA